MQGDDPYYIKGAQHALIDPLHPTHAKYVFQGDLVDMRGHPHPPLDSWTLAALILLFGDVREVPFHAFYILFSLLAAACTFAIALRFTTKPLIATLLFIVTPAFVINGNSFEADIPFVAFWLAAIAAFIYARYTLCAVAAVLAALTAYQAIVMTPILALWLWMSRTRPRNPSAWIALFAAPLTVAVYQLFERITGGALPAQILAGYMSSYALQTLVAKLKNAAALTAHTGWLVFPLLAMAAFRRSWIVGLAAAAAAAFYDQNPLFWLSFGAGAMILAACLRDRRNFLPAWILVFFAAALVLFFAGSARYLLPIGVPVAILVADRLSLRWLAAGAAGSALISLSLAIVNYQHQAAYRSFQYDAPRIFTNAEWGLRYYLESRGARAITRDEALWPGDAVITTAYAPPVNGTPGAVVLEREIQSSIPLRTVGLGCRSGYSSVVWGLRPFDISLAPLDRVRVEVVAERKPILGYLNIGTPEAAAQIVSGIYNSDRWTGERATVILKRPPDTSTVEASFFVPPQSPARSVQLLSNGRLLATDTFSAAGVRKVSAPAPPGDTVSLSLVVDKTFVVPPDQRKLGVLLTGIGFK